MGHSRPPRSEMRPGNHDLRQGTVRRPCDASRPGASAAGRPKRLWTQRPKKDVWPRSLRREGRGSFRIGRCAGEDSRPCLFWASEVTFGGVSATPAIQRVHSLQYRPRANHSCRAQQLRAMQGFWRRTKPWQPSKQPRPHPPNLGPALEWTFRDNMEEVVSVQSIFLEQGELWTPPPARPVAAQAAPPPKKPVPIVTVQERMQLAYVLNASPSVPRPLAPEARDSPKRSTTSECTFNESAKALKRHRSSM